MRFALVLALPALVCACKSDAQKCQASTFEENIPICQRACDANDAKSCDRLGYIHMLYRHNAEAKTAYQKACDLGYGDSCAWVKK